MSKRNWKRVRPNNLPDAMELCLEYARERHNRSVDRIADLMGLKNKWAIYKLVESGTIPALKIRPFEHACGATFVTWWLAYGAHKLLIDIPKGRKADDMEISQLQAALADASAQLIRFYNGAASADDTISQITGVMGNLAWHRENVARQASPELDLFNEGATDND